MKRFVFVFLGLAFVASAQNLDTLPPAERARAERQNETLRALLHSGPQPAVARTALPGWSSGMVSWVASDRHGLVYVLQRDLKKDPVVVLDRAGKVVRSWGQGLYVTPHAIRIDPQGHVWTTDAASSMVYEFSPSGEKLLEIDVGGLPAKRSPFCGTTDIAFAPDGHLFISDGYANARILEYTPQGKKLREWGTAGRGPGQFRIPHSIQIDETGVIYVADRENGRIQRFDLHGKFLGEWDRYGKTFCLTLAQNSLWLSTIPRGPNGTPGWLVQIDRASGELLGSVATTATHGLTVTADGDLVSAWPSAKTVPLYRFRK